MQKRLKQGGALCLFLLNFAYNIPLGRSKNSRGFAVGKRLSSVYSALMAFIYLVTEKPHRNSIKR